MSEDFFVAFDTALSKAMGDQKQSVHHTHNVTLFQNLYLIKRINRTFRFITLNLIRLRSFIGVHCKANNNMGAKTCQISFKRDAYSQTFIVCAKKKQTVGF